MERTIPIFRALISCDSDDAYHRNHGQLGYALKDQRSPDWAAAEVELTKAIQIRGSAAEHNWLFYEMNRALCRIMLDEDFKQSRKSSSQLRNGILEDIKTSSADEYIARIMKSDATISRWISLNEETALR